MKCLDECHKSKLNIHPGVNKMYRDIKHTFWWKTMKRKLAVESRAEYLKKTQRDRWSWTSDEELDVGESSRIVHEPMVDAPVAPVVPVEEIVPVAPDEQVEPDESDAMYESEDSSDYVAWMEGVE